VNDVSVENADEYIFDDGSDDPSVLSMIQFTEDNVENALMNLGQKKGLGLDGISPSILRKIFLCVKALLTFIFNPSLASEIFPALWKEPLFKTGDKRDFFCYRGVSMMVCDMIM
jgi:hypothetical protein